MTYNKSEKIAEIMTAIKNITNGMAARDIIDLTSNIAVNLIAKNASFVKKEENIGKYIDDILDHIKKSIR